MGQRVQNRMLVTSTDIRQAQLNANTAIELALLTINSESNWRTTKTNGIWFTGRGTNSGTCTLSVTDPIDSNLANSADDSILISAIGYKGDAVQRAEVTIDFKKEPVGALRSAVAVGRNIDLSNDTLRSSGLITANETAATSSQIYGNVEAVTIGGSTYSGTTTQVTSANRPTMPDWTTVFNYYRTNGTSIDIGNLATSTPNLGRNISMTSGTTDWTGSPPWTALGTADITQVTNFKRSGTYSMRVENRTAWFSGLAQRIDNYVKPGGQYNVEMWVYVNGGVAKNFVVSLFTKGTSSAVQFDSGPVTLALSHS
jgi:hypothetical protein